jgi:hypothetical protein
MIGIFLLHLLNAYVYLGKHPFWPYISLTARKLLTPISFLSFPKFDLAPVLGIALVFTLAEFALKPAVVHILERFSS